MTEERSHSKYGMSGFHRYSRCPGSVRLCEQVGPQPPSPWAAEGTQAHNLLEALLKADRGATVEENIKRNIRSKYLTVVASDDMYSAVSVAVDYVLDILEDWPDAQLFIEQEVVVPSSATTEKIGSTLDVAIYIPSIRMLYVIDYKHGAGEAVEIEGNEQVRGYALAVMSEHPEWVVDFVALVIIQPRIFNFVTPIPEEWVTPEEILFGFQAEVDLAITRCEDPNAPFVMGKKQCRFCAGKNICPAREQQMLEFAGDTFRDVKQITPEALVVPDQLTPDQLAYKLDAMDMLEDYIKAVRAEALRRAMSGVHIPGRKIVEALGKRSWDGSGSRQIAAGLASCAPGLAIPDFLKEDVVGIGEAEKLVKDAAKLHAPKGKAKAAVAAAVEKMAFLTTKKSSGSLSLVPESDPRPARSAVAGSFSGVVALPQIETGSGDQ